MLFYHGTSSILPFIRFSPVNRYRGLVSNKRFNGYFFTSEYENAAFFADVLIATVEITPINGMIYQENVIDGCMYSNVLFVPQNFVHLITILEWHTLCSKREYKTLLRRNGLDKENINCLTGVINPFKP